MDQIDICRPNPAADPSGFPSHCFSHCVGLYQGPLLALLVLLPLAPFLLALPGCGSGGPQIYSRNDKDELVPNFELSDSTPLPGNHAEKAIIKSASPTDRDPDDLETDPSSSSPGADGDGEEDPKKKDKLFRPDPENWRVKKDHWVAIQNVGKSKKEDLNNGVLKHSIRDGSLLPIPVAGTRYFLRTQRPASLAKDQPKRFESPLFINDNPTFAIVPELETTSRLPIVEETDRLLPMNPRQYHIVLLTDSPQTYRFLNFLPSIWNVQFNRALQDASFNDIEDEIDFSQMVDALQFDSVFYKLTISEWDDTPELPSNVQQWTSIAYLVWSDTFSADLLSEAQKQAMLDWIHFGGQLIVTGEANSNLKDSFLGPYLPVVPTGLENSDGKSLTELVQNWSLETDTNGELVVPSFSESEKTILTTWQLRPEATEVEKCGGLVAEREVGRGRICSVAFPLNQNKLRSWSGLDNWFNACLLRRPGRQYQPPINMFDMVQRVTADDIFRWKDLKLSAEDPQAYTSFRLWARDLNVPATDGPMPEDMRETAMGRRIIPTGLTVTSEKHSPGAWADYSPIASAARATLKDQAGITPPKREWVLQALLIYLAVLIPVNYLVFRVLGRLEWAWFAIPLIAVVGGVVVVRAASLDIGFSNKRLQVNVIEIVPEYSRAHLTGYGSLYSSLTTSFQFTSNNPTTLALPFPTANVPAGRLEGSSVEYTFKVGNKVEFGPQSVLSNTLEMYHFEQTVGLDGILQCDDDLQNVTNGTQLHLKDGVLLYHDPQTGRIQFATTPDLPTGQQQSLNWNVLSDYAQLHDRLRDTNMESWDYELDKLLKVLSDAEINLSDKPWPEIVALYENLAPDFAKALRLVAERRQYPPDGRLSVEFAAEALRESRQFDSEQLNLGRFSDLVSQYPMGPGEVRWFGWSDSSIGDFQIRPAASRVAVRNFVVATLKRPSLPDISSDKNLAYDKKLYDQPIDEELLELE